jgi:hypothetical protein
MAGDRRGSALGARRGESAPAEPARLERLRGYARLLDDGIRIPGTKLRFGLDPILGLIPGLGDVAGASLSVAIIWEAARRGVPRSTLLRMAFNVAMDAGLGAVPIVGDIFDAIWKANRSNIDLLDRHIGQAPTKATGGSGVIMLLAALFFFCVAITAGVAYLLLRLLPN